MSAAQESQNDVCIQSTPERSDDGSRHETISPGGNLYIPSLDGIRAISIGIVFVAHAGFGHIIPGGFGVSIFFLLSGFLITTLLRMEFSRHGRISLQSFYLRRVLRILPPLYVVLALAMVLCALDPAQPGIPLAGTLAQALQVANFYEIYAAHPQLMAGTGVLWSLAVEEHFYLLFPLAYGWMCSRFSAARQGMILSSICILALAWRCILHYHFHVTAIRTYYATDTRFDSILIGCIVAIVANPVFRDQRYESMLERMKWLLPLSAGVLLGTFVIRSDDFRETLRYTIQGIALVPIFIAAIQYQRSALVRILNLPFVRFVGVISYTLYLCHAVVLQGIREAGVTNPIVVDMGGLAVALCFSTAVHYWIERPCTRVRKRLSRSLNT